MYVPGFTNPVSSTFLVGIPPVPSSPVVGVGARTPRATHVSLTGRPTHIPLPTRTRSASEASMGGFGLGLGLGMMSPSGAYATQERKQQVINASSIS